MQLDENVMRELAIELITTGDGSTSLYNATLNETYHSIHGAVAESMHVFIETGLAYYINTHNPTEVKIFEVGLGTGLNAYLTLLFAIKYPDITFYYSAIDTLPMQAEMVQQINYPELLQASRQSFEAMHTATAGQTVNLAPNFVFERLVGDVNIYPITGQYNIVYFDAFAPQKQPDMWETSLFTKLYALLLANGIMVTYCAQGEFRRKLISVGFSAERLPGPPNKREMTRVTKAFA